MQLYDRLQICLLAVASRYPDASVEINEDILGFQSIDTTCWRSVDLIDFLQGTSPEVLQAMSLLRIDQQQCAIYLATHSQETPAFILHCKGDFLSSKNGSSAYRGITTATSSGKSKKNFLNILVPLDGSTRAEQALPIAAHIARTCGGSLTIVQAIQPSLTKVQYATGVREDARLSATHYLERVLRSKDLAGITTTPEIVIGPAAEMIFATAQLHQNDLIVMCSHGETGLKRRIMGSVAQKITRTSSVPVLVIREEDHLLQQCIDKHRTIHIMIALDGSPLAEATLVPAAYLSAALSSPNRGSLHLVRVLPLPSTFEYGQNDSVAQAIRRELPTAKAYLHEIEQRLRKGELASLNLHITTAIDHDLDIAGKLLWLAKQGEQAKSVDVIALATHGRSGMKRLAMGSIAERILSTTHLPMLVVRPLMA